MWGWILRHKINSLYLPSRNAFRFNSTQPKHTHFILGCAGTGKTQMLASRVVELINDGGVSPEKILLIAPVYDSQIGLQSHLDSISPFGTNSPECISYRTFCNRVFDTAINEFSSFQEKNLLPNDVQLLSSAESYAFLKEKLFELPLNEHLRPRGNPERVLRSIQDYFRKMSAIGITPEIYLDWTNHLDPNVFSTEIHKSLANSFQTIWEIRRQTGQLEIEDATLMILHAINTLKKNSSNDSVLSIISKIASAGKSLSHILVDDAQDLTPVIIELLKNMQSAELTIAADPWQSINGYRGATIRSLIPLIENNSNIETTVLGVQHRSSKAIASVVSHLLKKNFNPNAKKSQKSLIDANLPSSFVSTSDFIGSNQFEGVIRFQSAQTKDDELASILNFFVEQIQDPESPISSLSDCAILVKKSSQVEMIVAELREKYDLSAVGVGTSDWVDFPLVRGLLSFLGSIVNPQDELYFFDVCTRLYSIPEKLVSESLHAIRQNSERPPIFVLQEVQKWKPILEVFQKMDLYRAKLVKETQRLQSVEDSSPPILSVDNQNAVESSWTPLQKLIRRFLEDTNRLKPLEQPQSYETLAESHGIIKLGQLIGNIERSIWYEFRDKRTRRDILNARISMFDPELAVSNAVVQRLSEVVKEKSGLMSNSDDWMPEDAVKIMTIHRSKGREFGIVAIPSCLESVYPGYNVKLNKIPEINDIPTILGIVDPNEFDTDKDYAKRLLYTAITRAKYAVLFTAPNQHLSTYKGAISRYIAAMNISKIPLEFDQSAQTDQITPEQFDLKNIDPQNLPPHLSYSSMNSYLTCPKSYWYSKVLQLKSPRAQPLMVGSALHEAVAKFWELRMKHKELEQEDYYGYVLEVFHKHWDGQVFSSDLQERERLEHAEEGLISFIQRNLWSPPPLLIEHRFNIIADGVRLVGVWDKLEIISDKELDNGSLAYFRQSVLHQLSKFNVSGDGPHSVNHFLDSYNAKIRITEYKSNLKKEVIPNRLRNNLQLNTYAVVCKKVFGQIPSIILESIETGDSGEAHITEKDIQKTLETMKKISFKIGSQEYDPAPSMFSCGFCTYQGICEHRFGSQASKKKSPYAKTGLDGISQDLNAS